MGLMCQATLFESILVVLGSADCWACLEGYLLRGTGDGGGRGGIYTCIII